MNVFPHESAEDALADILEAHRALLSAVRLDAHERASGARARLSALLDELLTGPNGKLPEKITDDRIKVVKTLGSNDGIAAAAITIDGVLHYAQRESGWSTPNARYESPTFWFWKFDEDTKSAWESASVEWGLIGGDQWSTAQQVFSTQIYRLTQHERPVGFFDGWKR